MPAWRSANIFFLRPPLGYTGVRPCTGTRDGAAVGSSKRWTSSKSPARCKTSRPSFRRMMAFLMRRLVTAAMPVNFPSSPGCPQILTRNFCKGENAFMLCRRCGALLLQKVVAGSPLQAKFQSRLTTNLPTEWGWRRSEGWEAVTCFPPSFLHVVFLPRERRIR
jgi:hypothetical protein